MSKPLFDIESDSESDSGNNINLGTNKDYAKSYNKLRQKELLKKLKDKDACNESDSSSDSDSSDDDEAAFDPKFDAEFYKTLASLKQKDPKIYDKSIRFFDDEDSDGDENEATTNKGQKKKEKALTVKDYERKILVEKGGIYEDDEDEDEIDQRPQSPTYNEEQKRIKHEFKKLIDDVDLDAKKEEDWGGIFKKREKSKEETTKEDEEQKNWQESEEGKTYMQPLKEYWSNPKIPKDEAFLRDYILTNGYADKDDDEIPTYDEIVGDSDEEQAFEDKQTEFEFKYNFRFEEPDQEFIKRYPRTIEHSVRKTDDRRKVKRVEVRERKEREKQEKFKDIEMLKELKRKEMEEKISKLKAVTGTDELAINDEDLESDFDPEAHDKRMAELFDIDYYQVDEGEEKPDCPSDIEDLQVENYDDYDPNADENDGDLPHCEDNDFIMDCDYDASNEQSKKSLQEEMIENTMSRRKRRKRQSKFMEMLQAERPKFDPETHKSYSEYLDEYYKLDCEDIIGDVKCRFKYVETVPNDFGLTVDEILHAKNKELNQWASMKKATQIRPEHVERNEQGLFQKKARNQQLKMKILRSLYEESSDDEPELVENVSNPKTIVTETNENSGNAGESSNVEKKKIKKNKNKNSQLNNVKTVDETKNDAQQDSKSMEVIAKDKQIARDQTETSASNETTSQSKKRKLSESSETSQNLSKLQAKPQNVKPAMKNQNSQPAVKPKINFPNQKTNKGNANKKNPSAKANPGKSKAAINFNRKHEQSLKGVQKKTIDKRKQQKGNGLSDERLKAFGINPKKFHKKLKYGNQTADDNKQQKGQSNPKQKKPFNPPAKIPLGKNQAFKNKLRKALSKR